MTHADEARRILAKAGVDQCWCDLTKAEGGCPFCRAVPEIAAALAAAERAGIERAAGVADSIDSTDEHGSDYEEGQEDMRGEIARAIRALLPAAVAEPADEDVLEMRSGTMVLPAEVQQCAMNMCRARALSGEDFCAEHHEGEKQIAPAPDPATAPIAEVRAELERRGIDVGPATERVLAAVHAAKPEPNRVYWFAETLANSGEYATRGRPGHPCAMTRDPLQAARFETRHECIAFCCNSAVTAILPPLHPVEHMFMDRDVAEPAAKCATCLDVGHVLKDPETQSRYTLPCPSCAGAK